MRMPKFIITLLTLSFILLFAFPPSVSAGGDIEINLSGQEIQNSHLAVADFNKDGKKEIVVAGKDGMLYVIDGATYTIMWEKQLGDYLGETTSYIFSGITIADLNRDGTLEIVVATGGDPNFKKVGAVIILTYVGGSQKFTLLPGWPRIAFDELGGGPSASLPDGVPDGFESTPSVGDLDGNGDLEIVISGNDRRLHAWHYNGTYVTGWPIDRTRNLFRGGMSSPALADIDKDGLPEIIVGTYSYVIPACPNPYIFLVLNGDGSMVPGFPVYTSEVIKSSPAVGDIDGDGWLDIVVGTGDWNESCGQPADGRKVYAWDHAGHPLPGWPKRTNGNMLASPALGDLDGDGQLEVVVGCGFHYQAPSPSCTELHAWHGNGEDVSGFPMSPESIDSSPYPILNAQPNTPILSDFDGDGQIEIMTVGAGSRGISIVEADGTMSSDQHRTTAGYLLSSPLVDDIDGDGLLETVIGGADDSGKAAIYIWQETGTINSARPWPMFHHDIARSGLYQTPIVPQLISANEVRILHQQGSPTPAGGILTISQLGSGPIQWQVSNVSAGVNISPQSGLLSGSTDLHVTVSVSGAPLNTWYRAGEFVISGTANGQNVAYSPRVISIWLYHGDLSQLYFPMVRANS